jgi:hypothetical protein
MRRAFLGLALVWALAWPRPAAAQSGRAELTGEIRDEAGAAVADSKVTVTANATAQAVTVTTGHEGAFNVPYLRPGVYRVEAKAPGFRRSVREGVQLATGERVRIDLVLSIGAFTEATTVTADAPLVQTETSSLGQVIPNRSIQQLPLNGRSFLPLVALVPGVALPPGSAFPRLNGGRPRVNEYLCDGISVLQPEPGTVPYFPIVDAIQEFKVVTNTPPAEFGRFNGGVINLSTKAGGNELHGAGFEFLRNEALNARNLFAPATAENPDKPAFQRNQFGFVLGGPIAKDRTFFFVDYQGTRQSIGRVRISTVPTALQRQGIFTEPVGGRVATIYDPATGRPAAGGGTTRDPFAGNAIPAARIDPVTSGLLGRYPLPNLPGTANNYRRVANEDDDQDQFDLRLDHRTSPSHQLFARFSYFRDHRPCHAPARRQRHPTTGVTPHGHARAVRRAELRGRARPAPDQRSAFRYTRRSVGRSPSPDGTPSAALACPRSRRTPPTRTRCPPHHRRPAAARPPRTRTRFRDGRHAGRRDSGRGPVMPSRWLQPRYERLDTQPPLRRASSGSRRRGAISPGPRERDRRSPASSWARSRTSRSTCSIPSSANVRPCSSLSSRTIGGSRRG